MESEVGVKSKLEGKFSAYVTVTAGMGDDRKDL